MRSVQWTVSMKSHHEILDNLSVTKPLDTLILAFKSYHYEELKFFQAVQAVLHTKAWTEVTLDDDFMIKTCKKADPLIFK